MTCSDISEAFEKYSDMVYRICFMYFKDNTYDIEDAVSAVFLKYIEHGKIFESAGHEKAWLIVTAQNYCRDVVRSWWNKKRTPVESTDQLGVSPPQQFEVSELMSAVMSLPEKQRNAVWLHFCEGYSVEEIANIYYTSKSAVYKWIEKGRKKLKQTLSQDFLPKT